MMRMVMGTLTAMLISGVALAETSTMKLNKEVGQLDAEHQQLAKVDAKTAAPDKQPNQAQKSPAQGPVTSQAGRTSGPAKTSQKNPAMVSMKMTTVSKGPHDAAKADANNADASGSLGTGASQHTLKVTKAPHDAAKSDAYNADASGSLGTGASQHTLKVSKAPHDAAKADASNADASASIGTGASTHTLKNERMLGAGGQRNDADSSFHEGVHGGGVNSHFGGFGGASHNNPHGGMCHRGGFGC